MITENRHTLLCCLLGVESEHKYWFNFTLLYFYFTSSAAELNINLRNGK